jgi:flagellar motility protein MotE (MotC chaperone)
MTRLLRDVRLVPIVLVAIICLFALKIVGLVFDGGYTLNDPVDVDVTGSVGTQKRAELPPVERPKERSKATAEPKREDKRSWAQQMFNYPDVTGSVDTTKSTPAPTEAVAKGDKGDRTPVKTAQQTPAVTAAVTPPTAPVSVAERAILERLSERRAELEAHAHDLDMREGLLKAAEKRLEGRINELKDLEARLNTAAQAKSEGEVARLKNVVMMYENMKAKDAAKIFDRLELRVLVEVATQINPRRMSDILAQMTPEAAERLTMELASRAKDKALGPDLPKIEGRPTAN